MPPLLYAMGKSLPSEKGASLEAVQLMRETLPSSIKIKASGGIRTYEFAKALIAAVAFTGWESETKRKELGQEYTRLLLMLMKVRFPSAWE